MVGAPRGGVVVAGWGVVWWKHARASTTTTFFRLPEGRRGFFLGGGGTVHVSRLLGPDRMTELMLTGRKVDAEEGQRLGLSHYLVPEGESLAKALELAEQVSENAPIANYMIVNAISQISEMPSEAGLFTESIAQALSLTRADAKQGIDEFLINKRDARFGA
ncbi:enoyl-CoA hydratase-related protein [Streptomyces sp. NPDC057623]|uniref:enoyl-CoA hydratase-related protein n=1 Tax=Streptomyces sp. NPDC057623 TaxID=3346187 RepID=UPI0036A389B7